MKVEWWTEEREEQWMKHGPRRPNQPIYGDYFRKHGYTLWRKVTADEDNDKHWADTFTVREGWQ